MPKSIESLVSFSAGEWSTTLSARVDQQKYRSACIQLRNMIALKTGPATRRPGTQMVAPCKVIPGGNYCARMEDFQFEVNTKFAIEWGHNYVRFYSNDAQVVVDVGTIKAWDNVSGNDAGTYVSWMGLPWLCILSVPPAIAPPPFNTQPDLDPTHWVQQAAYEVATPYSALVGSGPLSATEVYQLKFCPINDVIYVNHPNHPRGKLSRFGDTDWVYEIVQDNTPALLDQNATDTTIAASAATGATNLTASAPTWQTGFYYDVGSSVVATSQAGAFVIGNVYLIASISGTDFTVLGASANTIGLAFTATGTGVGNGTGTATAIYVCNTPHVSGTFSTDYFNGDWSQQILFLPGHVGSYWELSYLRASAYVEYDGTAASGFAAGISNTITAFGSWEVHSYGVWSADIAVQASSNGGQTWQTVRQISGRNDRNVDITGTAAQAQLYRIVVSNVSVPGTPGVTNPRIVFECVDAFLSGVVQITAVTDPWHATAEVFTQLTVADAWISGFGYLVGDRVGYAGVNYVCIVAVTGSTIPPSDGTHWKADGWPTIYWSEGAWSAVRGYPGSITCFEQRIWCGGTAYQPQRIWGTQTDDIENWDLGDGTLATDGMAFDLDAVGDGSILWMQSQDSLFVGMVEAEWVVSPSDGTSSISPTNISAHRQSRWGSNVNIPAIVVGDALVFAQRQGFSLRQMLFSVVTNKYMSQDLTALSDQILNGGAIQMCYQKQGSKNGFVWATTLNGELVGMTYELDQEVFGWHRHFTGLGIDAGFESVCCIEGTGTADDEVWCVVNRQINGVSTRFVERVNPINWQTVVPQTGLTPGYGADKDQAYYVDCGLTYSNPVSSIFGGLAYLAGRTVSVCINALDCGQFLVSQQAGTFIVNNTYQILSIGTTDFTLIGAASNTVGLFFVATGPGVGGVGVGTAGGDINVANFTPTGGVEVVAQIGLPYTSTVQPMNLDVDVHTGVTQGIKKKVTGLTFAFLNTLGCKATDGSYKTLLTAGSFVAGQIYTIVSVGSTDFTLIGATSNTPGLIFTATGVGAGSGTAGQSPRVKELIFRQASNVFGEIPLFTGYKTLKDFAGSYGYTIPIIIFTDGPLPLTVLGVAVDYNPSGTP